ncbi:hypothetical protein MITSMUL_04813 [Mitsuokella multacida DSM 20544]|uniref:Uncharacterized protein n=1 Tax=Mitsuokella multacida DSM 20544 TaxID=500635 RepID=C9KN02_9FIRM|nr:hypothetical protein MITSMUL_04813 [Mitsuokella multacida DSM 20544]
MRFAWNCVKCLFYLIKDIFFIDVDMTSQYNGTRWIRRIA